MKYCFGDIVVVDNNLIGVIVKSWIYFNNGKQNYYEVYVREYNGTKDFNENEIQRYMVRHKYLNDEELKYQKEVGSE